MRTTFLTSAAILGLSAGAALAQSQPSQTIRPGHVPGVGDSYPASSQASNINGSDARSTIAPRLPEPPGGAGAGPQRYIRDAQRALMHHQTGQAQEAIEMAQTRLLDRSVVATDVNAPDQSPAVASLEAARQALAKHDWKAAQQALGQADTQTAAIGGMPMTQMPQSTGNMNGSGMNAAGMSGGTVGGMANGSGAGMNGAAAPSSGAVDEGNGMHPPSGPNLQP